MTATDIDAAITALTDKAIDAAIRALDRKIDTQAGYAADAEAEKARLLGQRDVLVRARIARLEAQLPATDEPNAPRTLKGQQEYLAKINHETA